MHVITMFETVRDNLCFALASYFVGLANMLNRKLASDLSSRHQAGAHSRTLSGLVVLRH